jgi:hypothetical protein
MGKLNANRRIGNDYLAVEPGLTAVSLFRGSNASWIGNESSSDFIIMANGKEIDGSKLRLVSVQELHEGKQT